MALAPMAMYGLEIPPGDVALSARPDIPSAFRITMAALDPSAEAEGDEGAVPRATLKVIRQSLLADDDDDDSDDFDQDMMEQMLAEDYSDEDSEGSSDGEQVNGGPSDPAKTKKARKEAAKLDIQKLLEEEDGMEVDDESDEDAMPNGANGTMKSKKALGKMPASDEDDDEDSEMDEEFMEEYVICTLDPTKLYQQPLDLTFGEDEKVWFKVSGTHSIYLTGNYVEPLSGAAPDMFDPDSDEEEDYDLEPDMDELEDSDDDDDSIEDELDDIENPRITEIDVEEEVPTLVNSKKDKAVASKNKRPAVDSDDEDATLGAGGLDDMITEAKLKVTQPAVNGDKNLSKKERKKLKKNDGAAASPPIVEKVVEKKEVDAAPSSSSNKSDKKVSFAKDLEQGPTPTPTKDSKDAKSNDKAKGAALGVKTVQGVTLDDKKLGTGHAAKNGDRVSMRYIGKLQADNSQFDANKKGKPFSFKLGAKEVIQGWEIGVQGMQAGGERRITIPAHLAYGSKKLPGIPANSTLVFDIKVLEVGKK